MSAAAPHVDSIVVGSGFGASVVAYRLAEAGRDVLLLERGKRYPPDSFPRSPREMARSFWDPSEGHYGLFDVWSFKKLDAVVASGLGGGSLIYANVLLRKDPKWFEDLDPSTKEKEPWPFDANDLADHYSNIEHVLDPKPSPYDLPKTRALRDAASELQLTWELAPLAVTFGTGPGQPIDMPSYGSVHGRDTTRRTCRLCGECNIGCNDGSKNTLDHTYLSMAQNLGADIRDRHEVRSIERRPDGRFRVEWVIHPEGADGQPVDTYNLKTHAATCTRLVMGAGALGTPFLLLKNRLAIGGLSQALGTRVCGNGDVIGMLMRARHRDGSQRQVDGERGPVITSYVKKTDGRLGVYVEDAGYPEFISWLSNVTFQLGGTTARVFHVSARRVWDKLTGRAPTRVSKYLQLLLGELTTNASSMPLLGMGLDVADGAFTFKGNRLDCSWKTNSSKRHIELTEQIMRSIAEVLGAEFYANPAGIFKRLVTVHPLGGAPASIDPASGVVNEWGEAHGVPGLWVVDGSAMPGPIGSNPSLTIAAFADRAATRMLATGGRSHG